MNKEVKAVLAVTLAITLFTAGAILGRVTCEAQHRREVQQR